MGSRLLLGIVVAALVAGAAAQELTFPPKPPEGYVADEAGVLSAGHRAEINRISQEVLLKTGAPIVVAVVQSLKSHHAGYLTVEQYARLLFDHWGPGSQTNNKGMLLFVSIGDRKARIEMGGGWMGQLNAAAQSVMDGAIIPEFKQGRFSEGVLAGVKGLAAINGNPGAAPEQESGSNVPFLPSSGSGGGTGLLACCFAPLAIILRFLGGGGGFGSGNNSSSWGGGSSGGGFSGGTGGGGGASGSW